MSVDEPADWADRERHWRRKLGRLKLGVEPLADQLERHRRATGVLTFVSLGIALCFLAIFGAFGRFEIGLIVGAALFVPIVGLAWWDLRSLERRADRYESERRTFERAGPPSAAQGPASGP